MWPFNIYRILQSKERYIWIQARILYETDKAILVESGIKIWIPKSQICGIKLRKSVFEIYVKKNMIG